MSDSSTFERLRGPDPDRDPDDIERLGQILARMYSASENARHASGWERWMLTLCSGLALTGIVGAVVMYGALTKLDANQLNQSQTLMRQQVLLEHQQTQIDHMQGQLDELLREVKRP